MAIPDWHRGHVNSFWGNEHRTLDYQTELFNNYEDMLRWREEGFDHPQDSPAGRRDGVRYSRESGVLRLRSESL